MQTGSRFECDNCGGDAGNGGVNDCVVVADLERGAEGNPTGHVVNHHFCRANGCDKKLLRKAIMGAYRERHDAELAEASRIAEEQRAAEEERLAAAQPTDEEENP